MKTLLFTCIFILGTFLGYAQCTPDPSRISPGNYTSAGEGLMNDAEINKPYTETITFIPQVTYDTFGFPIVVDSIMINQVKSLPTGLSFQTKKLMVKRGEKTCIQISGTPTAASEVGTIDIILDLTYYANGGNSIKHPKTLKLELVKEKAVSVPKLKDPAITVKIFPNPVTSRAKFQITNPTQDNVSLNVYDLFGKKVYENKNIELDHVNSFAFDGTDYSRGIYIYQLTNGTEKTIGHILIEGP
ncbi:MAG: hypothetical protein CL840_09920 [Crocinitomicaceae bacterium]|nr:hypothetical protein [Crocinitomicaceae bacterium]|tara:strand:- start:2536 stop:3267 length:732 start_codon:yes stop_codon:yes gene_type:complete